MGPALDFGKGASDSFYSFFHARSFFKGLLNPKNFIHMIDVIGPPDYEFVISIFIIPTISKVKAVYER